jgi:hypothetical protein
VLECRVCGQAVDYADAVCRRCGRDLMSGRITVAPDADDEARSVAPPNADIAAVDLDVPLPSAMWLIKGAAAAIPAFMILALFAFKVVQRIWSLFGRVH